jgi:hypothetical protein
VHFEVGAAAYGRFMGLGPARAGTLTVTVRHASFDDWREPFMLGAGPAGGYVQLLPDGQRHALRERCRQLLGAGPFSIEATAWAVTCPAIG